MTVTLSQAPPTAATTVKTVKPPQAPRRKRPRIRLWTIAFLLPAIVLFSVFDYYPFIRALLLSMQATDLFGRPRGFVGLRNYEELFGSSTFWRVLSWTLVFTVVSVAAKIAIGISIAVPLSYRLKGTWFMRSAVLVPMAVSTAVGTLVFGQIFTPFTGVADRVAQLAGVSSLHWLTDATMARIAVIVVDSWTGISFVTLLLLAAIDGVPSDVIEAAQLDGCDGTKVTWHIIIPLVSPMILFLTITQSVAALREFTIFNVLTGGGPAGATTTLVVDVYDRAFGNSTNDFAGAATNGMVLFLLSFVLSLAQLRIAKSKVTY